MPAPFQKRLLGPGTLCFLLASAAARGQTAGPQQVATQVVVVTAEYVNRVAEEMRANHPALRAAGARALAAKLGADAVRQWDDPMVKAGGLGARTEMRADEGDLIYGVEQ